jgi:hypothetical protein
MGEHAMSGRSAILAGLVALLVAGGSSAQPWTGPAGLEVRVNGQDGGVAGAVVRLSYRSQALETGPSPVVTDGNGRATLTGLAGGTWQVEIAHPDYMTFVAVVELAGEDKPEVTASFLEATDSSTTSMKVRFGRARGPASPPLRLTEEPAGEPVQPAPAPAPVRPEPPIEPPTADDDAANPPDAGRPPARPEPPPPPATPEPDEPPAPAPSPPEPPSREPEPPAEPEEPPAAEPAPPEPDEPVIPAPPETEPEAEEPPAAEPAPIPEPEEPAAPEPAEPQETEPEPAERPDAEPAPAPEPGEPEPPKTEPEPAEPPDAELDLPGTSVAPAPTPVPPVEPTVAPAPLPPPAVPAPEVDAVRSYSHRTCVECRAGEWAVAARVVSAGGGGCSRGDLDALDAVMAAVAETDALELEGYAGPLEGARGLLDGETASALDAALAGLPGGCAAAAVVLPRNARFSAFQYEASAGGPLAPCLPDQPCEGAAARWHGPPHLERGANATLAFGLFHSDAPTAGYLTVYFQAATPGWEPGRMR